MMKRFIYIMFVLLTLITSCKKDKKNNDTNTNTGNQNPPAPTYLMTASVNGSDWKSAANTQSFFKQNLEYGFACSDVFNPPNNTITLRFQYGTGTLRLVAFQACIMQSIQMLTVILFIPTAGH
ncbi:MAG: hypothetical protein AB7O73_07620 [Bacteroidia bacterium]